MAELDALLEAERQGKLDRSGKGNSLFSEVEDRREKVEVQLKVFEEKFSLLKENYDSKLRELQKTKLHNAQLLGLVGGRGGGEEHSARLEELLEVERERNRQLSDRLDSLEKGGLVGQVVSEEQVPAVKEGSEEGEMGQHTTSPEFAYMAGLVKELHHVLHAPPKLHIHNISTFRVFSSNHQPPSRHDAPSQPVKQKRRPG